MSQTHDQVLLSVKREGRLHLLFIQGTPAIGESAVFPQGFSELGVEFVSQGQWDSFPHQDENHNHCSLTGVASSLPHQAQQFLFTAASANHLCGSPFHPNTPTPTKTKQGSLVAEESNDLCMHIFHVWVTIRATFASTCNLPFATHL